jgi:hypothetical protein
MFGGCGLHACLRAAPSFSQSNAVPHPSPRILLARAGVSFSSFRSINLIHEGFWEVPAVPVPVAVWVPGWFWMLPDVPVRCCISSDAMCIHSTAK